MSQTTQKDSRWYIVMTGLLYPAFLGALMYEGFEKLVALPAKDVACPCATIFLIAVMLALFIFDYVYTYVCKTNYDGRKFLCDLVIIIFLYFSFKVAFLKIELPYVEMHASFRNSTLPEQLQWPAIWLFLTKLASVIWEYSERDKNNPVKYNSDLKTDLYAGNIYLLIYLTSIADLLSNTFATLFLAIAVIFDIWWYYQNIIRSDPEGGARTSHLAPSRAT